MRSFKMTIAVSELISMSETSSNQLLTDVEISAYSFVLNEYFWSNNWTLYKEIAFLRCIVFNGVRISCEINRTNCLLVSIINFCCNACLFIKIS